MGNIFTEAEFLDFVDGVGECYDYEGLRGEQLATALRVAERISGSEREEFTSRLLSYLTDIANRGVPDEKEILRVVGAFLILGNWGIMQAIPVISRFLKSKYRLPFHGAVDSLDMLTRVRP